MKVCPTCKQKVKQRRKAKPKPQPKFRHRAIYSSWITRCKKQLDRTGLVYEKECLEVALPLFHEARDVFDTGAVDDAIVILKKARAKFWQGERWWWGTSWTERNDPATWLPGRQPNFRF